MKRLLVISALACAVVSAPLTSAHAQLGLGAVDDWVSGQNEMLMHIWLTNLEQATQLSTLIINGKLLLGSMNETLALGRRAYAVARAIAKYDLNKLREDAKRALHRTFPDLKKAEEELNLLIANGEAFEQGGSAFFSHVDKHDYRMSEVARRTFEHGYQASIWPMVFPEAMKFRDNPTDVEALIQHMYERSGETMRRSLQQTSMSIIAQKVRTLVEDAEQKDDVQKKADASNLQVNYQTMQNSTDLLNLTQQEAAARHADNIKSEAFSKHLADDINNSPADFLLKPGGTFFQ